MYRSSAGVPLCSLVLIASVFASDARADSPCLADVCFRSGDARFGFDGLMLQVDVEFGVTMELGNKIGIGDRVTMPKVGIGLMYGYDVERGQDIVRVPVVAPHLAFAPLVWDDARGRAMRSFGWTVGANLLGFGNVGWGSVRNLDGISALDIHGGATEAPEKRAQDQSYCRHLVDHWDGWEDQYIPWVESMWDAHAKSSLRPEDKQDRNISDTPDNTSTSAAGGLPIGAKEADPAAAPPDGVTMLEPSLDAHLAVATDEVEAAPAASVGKVPAVSVCGGKAADGSTDVADRVCSYRSYNKTSKYDKDVEVCKRGEGEGKDEVEVEDESKDGVEDEGKDEVEVEDESKDGVEDEGKDEVVDEPTCRPKKMTSEHYQDNKAFLRKSCIDNPELTIGYIESVQKYVNRGHNDHWDWGSRGEGFFYVSLSTAGGVRPWLKGMGVDQPIVESP